MTDQIQATVSRLLAVMAAAAVFPAFAQIPDGVSPGAIDQIAEIEGRCPSFSWGSVPGAEHYQLIGYRLPEGIEPSEVDLSQAEQVLYTKVGGTANSWTPNLTQCLTPGGNYAWFVRAVFREDEKQVTEASEWSYGRFFKISNMPSSREVEEALSVLRRHTGHSHSGAAAVERQAVNRERSLPSEGLEIPPPGQKSVSSAKTAIRGNVPDAAGETYGVVGISNSANGAGLAAGNTNGGADLVLDGLLDGQADTVFTQAGIDRASTGELWFSLINSDAGVLSLNVEGQIVGNGTGLTGVAADTAAALAANGANCSPGMVALGVNAAGVAECTADADTLANLSCADGQIAKWNTGSTSWTCAPDSGAVGQNAGDGRFYGDLRIDNDLGIGADPLPGTDGNIYLYDGGIYSNPFLAISGHNSALVTLERRRTDGGAYSLKTGCGSVNCTDDFTISRSGTGTCIAIRDGCDVDIPKLEVDTFKLNPTDSPGTCDSANEGRMYHDDSLSEPCYCSGSQWTQFDGGGAC
jgi:hypothetical protein